jgi:hypothetical protein
MPGWPNERALRRLILRMVPMIFFKGDGGPGPGLDLTQSERELISWVERQKRTCIAPSTSSVPSGGLT